MTPVLTLPFLLMSLAACSEQPTVVYKSTYIYPPAAYLVPCVHPTSAVKTWADVGRLAIARGSALEECSGRVDAIRKWQDDTQKEEGGK